MLTLFEQLNGSDAALPLPADDEQPDTAALRRVLGRLGEYAAQVIAPLNMRPTSAVLLSASPQRVELRVSSASSHVLLVIAPAGDLSAEVFFLRAVAPKNLPIPRLLGHDQSRALVPFCYALESYVAGSSLDWLAPGPLMRMAARQVGRTLRRVHQLPAPGFGSPAASGRWPAQSWPAALTAWAAGQGCFSGLSAAASARLRARLLDQGYAGEPRVIHGALRPARTIVTVGEHAQLEALIRPGALVGGDPMFDLAMGLVPAHPEPFRQGLLEGYTAAGPLDAEQQLRLACLQEVLGSVDEAREELKG